MTPFFHFLAPVSHRESREARLIARLGKDLLQGLGDLFPSDIGRSGPTPRREPAPALPKAFADAALPLPARRSGYFERLDGRALMKWAGSGDVVLHVMQRPGQFVFQDSPLAHIYPAEHLTNDLREKFQETFTLVDCLEKKRDTEGSIEQLVRLACAALSPVDRDPFKALACINWLGAGLRALTGQPMPSPFRYDETGVLRVIVSAPSFGPLAEASFSEIRRAAAESPRVVIRLLEVARELAPFARRAEDRRWLRSHIEAVKEETSHRFTTRQDQESILASYEAADREIPRLGF